MQYKLGLLISQREHLKSILYLNIKIFSKVQKLLYLFTESFLNDIFIGLINDWSSSLSPDIYSYAPFVYDITLRGDHVELLVPSNPGNWIDCSNDNSAENSTK